MKEVNQWSFYEHYLIIYLIEKFIFTFLTLSLPIPAGITTPIYVIGAVIGQLYCSLLLRTLNAMNFDGVMKFRGIYSIIGAASLTTAVTRQVSVAVITLELSGHMSHAVPVLVCVITSYIISELINP
jgi:H+/Cl- antiporter ClcA